MHRIGDSRLLDRLGKMEWPGVSDRFRQKRFNHAIENWFRYHRNKSIGMLKWWVIIYLPDQFDACAEK